MSWLRGFALCWSFSTRLGPAMQATHEDVGRSIVFFPLVGLALGLVLTVPFFAGLATGHPLIQAWLFVALNWFATRGLHWDGWADLADGWGSQAEGARFWEIVKDARVGAFGVMGLILGMSGQLVFAYEVFASSASVLGVLAWSCVLGRTTALALAAGGRALSRPGLTQTFVHAATPPVLCLGLALCLVSGVVLVGPAALVCAGGLAGGGALWLWRLARRQQGLNGDFLGAAVVAAELAAPAGWLIAGGVFS